MTVNGLRPDQVVNAWADTLAPVDFDWFATLTFRRSVGPQAAHRAWGDWVRWLRRQQGHRTEWFRVTERTRAGAIHYHALVARCSTLRRLSALDYWRSHYGFGQVLAYDARLGARYYLSKYACKDAAGELLCDFSRCFKRLLRRGAAGRQPEKDLRVGLDSSRERPRCHTPSQQEGRR